MAGVRSLLRFGDDLSAAAAAGIVEGAAEGVGAAPRAVVAVGDRVPGLAARVLKGPAELLPAPRQIEAAWGASTYRHGGLMGSMEHIMYRHSAHSGFANVSRYARGTTAPQVMGYVDDALRYGNVTKTGPTAYTVEHTLGRTIGTNVAGEATSAIRIYVRDGVIQSAFPF